MGKNEEIRSWLESIRVEDDEGLLKPSAVVSAAADPNSPGHKHFTWDDKKAANKFRLQEAEKLIRKVYVLDSSGNQAPAFLSLLPDRQKVGGGYRPSSEVLTSQELRANLLLTAKQELQGWTQRYRMLSGLVDAVEKAAGIGGGQEEAA